MQGLISLASAMPSPETPVGFDTYRWLAGDVFAPRLDLESVAVSAEVVSAEKYEVNWRVLEEVQVQCG